MKRVNIQNDVESRSRIASATPQIPAIEPEKAVTIKPEETDAESQEIQGSAADTEPAPVTDTPPKRGRTAKGDKEKVSV